MNPSTAAKLAFRFVLLIGIVNFFADMTYEGARNIVGPFLGSLGASAATVGTVAGFGEFIGCARCSFPARTGRAIRRPAVEATLLLAGEPVGRGWVFGFNEALDQAGPYSSVAGSNASSTLPAIAFV